MVEKNSHRTKFLLLKCLYDTQVSIPKWSTMITREGNAFEDIPANFSWQDLIDLLGDKEKGRELSASFNN